MYLPDAARLSEAETKNACEVSRSDSTLDLHLPILLLENLRERHRSTPTVDIFVWVGAARVLEKGSLVLLKELAHFSVAVEGELVHDKVKRDLLVSSDGTGVSVMT